MPAYLDHNATTPLDARVLEAMLPYLRGRFGNGSSRHSLGREAKEAMDLARERVAEAVNAHPGQVTFTSGGTEANNLFIKGAAACLKPGQLVYSAIEHPCVANPAQELLKQGWRLRRLAVDSTGRLDRNDMQDALSEDTRLVSVMLANNETGVVQDVTGVSQSARERGALVHTDAVQALGKMPVDFRKLGVHALTLSGHKIYGPKGAGALVADKAVEIAPLLTGGGQEKGLRAGTENVAAIVGLGLACELAVQELGQRTNQAMELRRRLETGLAELGAVIFGREAERLANTTYFAFPHMDGETLVVEMDRAGFAVASGSACSSDSSEPSAVLLAMGVEPTLAKGAVRVSLGRDNTTEEIDRFLLALRRELERLMNFAALTV
jgi:cysteine desulfurase